MTVTSHESVQLELAVTVTVTTSAARGTRAVVPGPRVQLPEWNRRGNSGRRLRPGASGLTRSAIVTLAGPRPEVTPSHVKFNLTEFKPR